MMESLGKTLKSTRENVSLTLRDVENETGISSAYLSQLENDKIKKPSASILYKLSDVYKVEMNIFLHAAGIIEKNQHAQSPDQSLLEREIAFYKDKLTADEEKEVVRFIKFLRFKHGNNDSI